MLVSNQFKVLSLGLALIFAFAANAKDDLCDAILGMRASLERNDFVVDRTWAEYGHQMVGLDPVFNGLTSGSIWLDLGAGSARAQLQFAPRRRDVQLIALGVKRPPHTETDPQNFRYLEANFEALDARMLPLVNLMTDAMGVLSYTDKFDILLEKALRLLQPGGSLFLYYSPEKFVLSRLLGNQQLVDYLRLIEGVEILYPTHASVQIRRTTEPLAVPRLVLKKYQGGYPPLRVYSMAKSAN